MGKLEREWELLGLKLEDYGRKLSKEVENPTRNPNLGERESQESLEDERERDKRPINRAERDRQT